MRSLLDANVLIALLDSDHILNERAHEWFADERERGWASCPLTENAFIRVMSTPSYSRTRRFSISDRIEHLNEFVRVTNHRFWTDELSLLDPAIFSPTRIHRPNQITDLYLLALAAKNGGRLVTFDEHIALSAVPIATEENLFVL
ncbi:MAG: TA system VapC family ribonuclease toxin [Pyrinomonadaceae bacterium]